MANQALKLDVRTRRTLREDWTEEEVPLVACPLTGATRNLDECRHCLRSAGVLKDSTGHWFVVCKIDAAPNRPEPSLHVDPAWERQTVGEVMTGDPLCIHRRVEMSEILALFVEHGISGAPVVDDEGKPIGVVSRSDLLMEDYERVEENDETRKVDGWRFPRRAEDLMSSNAISVSERASVLEAVRLLAEGCVHRLPVVDDAGAVVGILSTLDLIQAISESVRNRCSLPAEGGGR